MDLSGFSSKKETGLFCELGQDKILIKGSVELYFKSKRFPNQGKYWYNYRTPIGGLCTH